jgi:hypothetical protein
MGVPEIWLYDSKSFSINILVHHYGSKQHLDPNTPFNPDAPYPGTPSP